MENEEKELDAVCVSDIQSKWEKDLQTENVYDKVTSMVMPTRQGYMIKTTVSSHYAYPKIISILDNLCKKLYPNYVSYEYSNRMIYFFFNGGCAA